VAKLSGRILLAVDGERHTDAAVHRALELAGALGLALNPVHVRDPYLKQFYTEIYAQGREEYLEHVQLCLEEKAQMAQESFETTAAEILGRSDGAKRPEWDFDVLDGDPANQLKAHLEQGHHSILVLGRRRRSRFATLKSRDLAERLLSMGCDVPMFIVPDEDQECRKWVQRMTSNEVAGLRHGNNVLPTSHESK